MENMIVMADEVGAQILNTSSNGVTLDTAVITFSEPQLNAFVNRVVIEVNKLGRVPMTHNEMVHTLVDNIMDNITEDINLGLAREALMESMGDWYGETLVKELKQRGLIV